MRLSSPTQARLAGWLLAVVLAACGGHGQEQQPVGFTDVTTILFRPFAAGDYVFRSPAELQAALESAPFRVFPIGLVTEEPAIPAWDFETTMIVGVSQGTGPWCTAPRIREVLSDGTDLVVRFEVAQFGTLACMRLAPLIGFAQVPRVPGRVEFRQTNV